jgi:hypothetical protein
MTYESRLRAFALIMVWLLRRHGGTVPADVSTTLERAEETLRDGDEADIRAALHSIDPAFSAARRLARQQHACFDAHNFLQYAACAGLSAVLIAIRADRIVAMEAADCADDTCADRDVAGWEELERTYRTVASSCRYAQLAGVAPDSLAVFQALLPALGLFDEG